MKISIQPVSVWTSTGKKDADQFEVRYVNYANGAAAADCHLWAGDTEVSAMLVNATAEQCAAWTDDESFYAVLAQDAGLVPAE